MSKVKQFDIGDYVVITDEITSPVMFVVGVDGVKLGCVYPLLVLIQGNQKPHWLDRSLFQKPTREQWERYKNQEIAARRDTLVRAMSKNLK